MTAHLSLTLTIEIESDYLNEDHARSAAESFKRQAWTITDHHIGKPSINITHRTVIDTHNRKV